MWIRLRQISIVAADLRAVSLDLGSVLGLEPCFTDPGVKVFGLKNMLWPIGSQFLEVVTPIAPGTAGGRYMDRRGGDSGYMVITQVDDIARRRARAAEDRQCCHPHTADLESLRNHSPTAHLATVLPTPQAVHHDPGQIPQVLASYVHRQRLEAD